MKVAEATRQYIASNPTVRDALARGIINYSALAREIGSEIGTKNLDAVLVACRRYAQGARRTELRQKEIRTLIRQARVRVLSKMMVVVVDKPRNLRRLDTLRHHIRGHKGDLNIIEGNDVTTIITNRDFLSEVRTGLKGAIKHITHNVVQISLIFDERINATPGVIAHLYTLFAVNNINILEEISCWTDVMVVIDEQTLPKAMNVLRQCDAQE